MYFQSTSRVLPEYFQGTFRVLQEKIIWRWLVCNLTPRGIKGQTSGIIVGVLLTYPTTHLFFIMVIGCKIYVVENNICGRAATNRGGSLKSWATSTQCVTTWCWNLNDPCVSTDRAWSKLPTASLVRHHHDSHHHYHQHHHQHHHHHHHQHARS